jgi:putative heme transporter
VETPTEKAIPKRSRKRQWIGGGLALAVIIGVFVFVLPRIADYRDVWEVVKTLSGWQILALVGATLLNLATYAPPSMAALPGLRYRQAFVVTQASTASTYVAPGGAAPGIAVSYAMLRAWGFKAGAVTLAVAVIGVWNQLVIFGFPIVALALLTLVGEQHPLLQTVALIGLGIFAVAVVGFVIGLKSENLAYRVGELAARIVSWLKRLFRRKPVTWGGESLASFRRDTVGLLRRRWHVLTAATLAGQLTVFVVLLVSLRVLEVPASDVSGIEAFAAWSIIRVLGSLPITPGGLGIVELGLTSLLVGFGGGQAEVVAAVLVYRFLTIVPTLLLGLVAGATWKRHNPGAIAPESAAVD